MSMGKFLDRTGMRYGNLIAIKLGPPIKTDTAWVCMCDCGKDLVVLGQRLSSGSTQSCGCTPYTRPRKPRTPRVAGQTSPSDAAARKWMYSTYRAGAANRGLLFAIDQAEFENLTRMPCYYCGALPSVRRARGETYEANGVDRVDNTLGYEATNVRPCCTTCNMAKKDMDAPDFISWALRLADHLRSKTGQEE